MVDAERAAGGENRQAAEEFIAQLTPEAPSAKLEKNASFFKLLGKEMLSYGIYSYAFAEPTPKVIEKLQQANLYFTQAIAFEIIMALMNILIISHWQSF